jgi:hypothetical protein
MSAVLKLSLFTEAINGNKVASSNFQPLERAPFSKFIKLDFGLLKS